MFGVALLEEGLKPRLQVVDRVHALGGAGVVAEVVDVDALLLHRSAMRLMA